uniref:Methyltransferase FkbM domain-containing protein n=1 Tax=Chromera velia CCMP2878 TaxID=1169474 RepID=A0A0G4I8Y1_9ALVE|mmetsp:Transcript_28978/g.56715  ORF Transcript_28978/g.56715 Transcript_28978/m.56715 type:complete len:394 (+) Transcript_28978:104-1285(+)|eukprot:Cvel_12087.t1-p1 / transcript=Cvel_12087.t1 / gene=Cvel_12087 / organism=Chromera_velia_CCMP2878 / gene_product=hypothetical protein / transcript_product=hypothetical protein / location=Cvel_scaffold778:18946-22785(+) / protein_length=393 / sequence_SO=supercontig / SO=protein_coding / is_pseudo=false
MIVGSFLLVLLFACIRAWGAFGWLRDRGGGRVRWKPPEVLLHEMRSQGLYAGVGQPSLSSGNRTETETGGCGFFLVRPARNGLFVLFPFDLFVSNSLFIHGVWSEMLVQLSLLFLPEGGWALDVGANIGAFTVPLAQRAGKKGGVVAFEPFRLTHQVLTTNVALNGLSNVHTFQAAASNTTGRICLPLVDAFSIANLGASSVRSENEGENEAMEADGTSREGSRRKARGSRESGWSHPSSRCEAVGKGEEVDSLMVDSLRFDRVDFVKIDVEGHELSVLQGALRTLMVHRPVVLVETDSAGAGQMFGEMGFDCRKIFNHPYGEGVDRGSPTTFYLPEEYENLLCVPKERPELMERGLAFILGRFQAWKEEIKNKETAKAPQVESTGELTGQTS